MRSNLATLVISASLQQTNTNTPCGNILSYLNSCHSLSSYTTKISTFPYRYIFTRRGCSKCMFQIISNTSTAKESVAAAEKSDLVGAVYCHRLEQSISKLTIKFSIQFLYLRTKLDDVCSLTCSGNHLSFIQPRSFQIILKFLRHVPSVLFFSGFVS